MKTTTTTLLAASAAMLSSAAHAASVLMETTQCSSANVPYQQFSVEVDTAESVAVDLPSICGLRILSSTPDTNLSSISCQAYKDAAGTQPGSAVFTSTQPALIATNPVQEQSIWCHTNSNAGTLSRRQNEGNSTTTSTSTSTGTFVTIRPSTSTGVPSSSLITSLASSLPAPMATNATSTVPRSTIVQTVIASASSGLPSMSGNATVPSNTGRPSASQSAGAGSTGGAGMVSVSFGMLVGAVVAGLMA